MKTLSLFLVACFLAVSGVHSVAQTTVTLSATDANAAETLAGVVPNTGNIRLSRTGDTTSALTVWVRVSGVAVQGVDYAFGYPINDTIVIPAGASSVNIPVTPIDDWLTEGAEALRVRLEAETAAGTPVPYTVGSPSRADITIADNEDPLAPLRAIVTVEAVDATATETVGAPSDPAVFRVSRTNNLEPELNILFSLGGTAVSDVDYTAPPATITIPAGVASVDVAILPIDDLLIENPADLTFTLLPTDIGGVPPPAQAYALGTAITATATIVSNDLPPPPTVTITTPGPSAAAASGRPLTVNFTASAVDGYIVSYAILGGGTTLASGTTNLPASTPAGTPYLGTGTVTFTGSYTFAQLSVHVTNSNGISATSAVTPVYLYIAPPDPPLPPVLPIINIYPLDAEGAEVAAGAPNVASFRVTHNFPATATVGFLFEIQGTARENVDYTLSGPAGAISASFLGRWFTFPAGATEAQIVVNPVDDLLLESTETVTMSLYTPPFIGFNEGGPNGFDPGTFGFYYGPNFTATVNVLSDDTTPPPFPLITIAATDPVGGETADDSDPVVFTITRNSGPTDVPLAVNYALTVPIRTTIYITAPTPMAGNGVDFPRLSGTATIPAGAVSTQIVVYPTYDLISEPVETLQLTLRPSATVWPAAGGYVLDEGLVATATIRDLALPAGTPIVWIRAYDTQAIEELTAPSRTATFFVERNGNLTNPLTVAYSVSGTATSGVDYVALPGTVTIPAGSPRMNIVVEPIADGIAEPAESVGITVEPPPVTTNPPPYVVGSTTLLKRSAGISIRDIYRLPSPFYSRRQGLLQRLHNRHVIVVRPVTPTAAPTAPPPPGPTSWTVEASPDLATWEPIGTVESIDEEDEFVDVTAPSFDTRFYRFRPVVTPAP